MKIIIDRFNGKEKYEQSYDIDDKDIQGKTLLSLLLFIKKTKDITLNLPPLVNLQFVGLVQCV